MRIQTYIMVLICGLVSLDVSAGRLPKRRTASAGKCEVAKIRDLKAEILNNCNSSTSVFAEVLPDKNKRATFCECVSNGHSDNMRARRAVYAGKEYFVLCLHKQTATEEQYQAKEFEDIIEVDAAIMDDCLNKAGVE